MSARAATASRRRRPGYRLRPAPRRSARGRGARIDWERLGRRALVLVLAAVLASYVNPVVNFVDAWKDSREGRARLAELRTENAELRGRAAALTDENAAEQAARRLGMVFPGERPYVIRGLER